MQVVSPPATPIKIGIKLAWRVGENINQSQNKWKGQQREKKKKEKQIQFHRKEIEENNRNAKNDIKENIWVNYQRKMELLSDEEELINRFIKWLNIGEARNKHKDGRIS